MVPFKIEFSYFIVCRLEMSNSSIQHGNYHATFLGYGFITMLSLINDTDIIVILLIDFSLDCYKLGENYNEPTVSGL